MFEDTPKSTANGVKAVTMFASVKVRNFDFCGVPLWVEVQEQQDHSHDEVNAEDHLMYEFSRMQMGNRLISIIEKEPSFQ